MSLSRELPTSDPGEMDEFIREFGRKNTRLAGGGDRRAFREAYLAALSTQVQVDVIGACGNNTCSHRNATGALCDKPLGRNNESMKFSRVSRAR